jgi:hypothetical protein
LPHIDPCWTKRIRFIVFVSWLLEGSHRSKPLPR